MSNTNLEKSIQEAAAIFAKTIINVIQGATLQELTMLQGQEEAPKRLGRKPGPKASPKPSPKPGPKPGRKPGRKPAGKVTAAAETKARKTTKKAVAVKKKRIVKNYPKCAYPGCENNRFVRGKGFCGEHWRMWKAGKIKSADKYKK